MQDSNQAIRGHFHVSLPLSLLLALAVFFGIFFLKLHLLKPPTVPIRLPAPQHASRLKSTVPMTGEVESVELLPDSGQTSLVFSFVGNPTRYRATPRSLDQVSLPDLRLGNRLRLRVSTDYPNVVLAIDVTSSR